MIPLFIGGTGRSGTTITLNLLGTHSKVYATIPSEIKILTEKNGLLEKYITKKINKNDVLLSYQNVFKSQETLKTNAEYWGDSTPDNIRSSPILSEVFPNSMFIHMIRDGRDSGYSEYETMNGKFHAKTPFDGLDFWHKRIVKSIKSLNNIDLSKKITLRLENLVINNRNIEKEKILNFLKLQNEEMFNNFFNTQVTPSQMSIGKWKNMNDWKEFDKKYNFILKNLEFQNIFIERYY